MMTKEEFKKSGYKCTYEEYKACYCPECKRHCIHNGAYRRMPKIDGGLGLCPNLKTIRSV